MKTLLLLAATVADPDEAWLFYQQALIKWQVIRSCSPKGHDDRIKEPMSELEESMEEVKGVLVAELADLYDVPGDDFEAEEDEIINAALERQAEQFREAKLDAEALLQACERVGGVASLVAMFDKPTEENKPPTVLAQYRSERLDEPHGGSEKKDDGGDARKEKSEGGHRNSVRLSD
nr:hypothetical protein B0A51_08655 [Rachicladosporium sp. CCFEE 5018]